MHNKLIVRYPGRCAGSSRSITFALPQLAPGASFATTLLAEHSSTAAANSRGTLDMLAAPPLLCRNNGSAMCR